MFSILVADNCYKQGMLNDSSTNRQTWKVMVDRTNDWTYMDHQQIIDDMPHTIVVVIVIGICRLRSL